jgi:hypothetical protein
MPSSRELDDPVPGLRTLRDAVDLHHEPIPASDKRKPHWKAAAEALLIMAAEDRGAPYAHADSNASGVEPWEASAGATTKA